MFENAFGRASDQQMVHRPVAMCTHHNKVCLDSVRLIQNFVRYRSGRLVQCDLDSILSDFFLPTCQLRLLIFNLWNRLWHRIQAWDRHARHRRKLWHSRETISQRAWRCGGAQFLHMNEMNLRIESSGELSRQIDHARGCVGKIDRHQYAFHFARLSLAGAPLHLKIVKQTVLSAFAGTIACITSAPYFCAC